MDILDALTWTYSKDIYNVRQVILLIFKKRLL